MSAKKLGKKSSKKLKGGAGLSPSMSRTKTPITGGVDLSNMTIAEILAYLSSFKKK